MEISKMRPMSNDEIEECYEYVTELVNNYYKTELGDSYGTA